MKDSKQVLSQSSLVLVVSTVVAKIISAVFKLPLASDSFLGDVGFGYFSLAHDLFMPFYILAISGLPVALSKITADFLAKKCYSQVKNNFYTAKRLFIILGIIFSALLALLAIPWVLKQGVGGSFYSIIAVIPSVFLCFVISVYRGYFEGFSNMYPTAVSKIIESLVKLVFGLLSSFLVIKATNNPALAAGAAILSVSVGTLLSTLYLHIKFKRNNPLDSFEIESQHNESVVTVKYILVLAIPFIISSLGSSIVALIDAFAVNFKISNASAEYLAVLDNMYPHINALKSSIDFDIATYLYGVKSKAFTIYNLIPTVTMSLGVAALPVLSEAIVSKDSNNLRNNTHYIIKLLSCITFPAALGLTALSGPIMKLLYSSENALDGNLLAIYGITAIFSGLAIPLTSVLQAFNLHYKALLQVIVGIVIKIVTCIVLLNFPSVNIYATPISTLACYLYIFVAYLLIIKRKINRLDSFKTMLKPLASALICAITAYLIVTVSNSNTFTVIAIISAALVYIISLVIFRTFTKSEVSGFLKLKKQN